MAPLLVFDDIAPYRRVEAGIFSGLTVILFIISIVAGIFAAWMCWNKRSKMENLKKNIHAFLRLMYPDLITKNIVKDEQDGTKPEREVYLFGGKEFNEVSIFTTRKKQSSKSDEYTLESMQKNRDQTNEGMSPAATTETGATQASATTATAATQAAAKSCSFLHFWTYAYFVLMVFLAGLWFIAIMTDNAIYRKTSTCNDINVLNNEFSCFNLDNHSARIDCRTEEAMDPDTPVFCYLFDPSPSAVAIGFSTFTFITFAITISFKVFTKIMEYERFCCYQWRCVLLIVQIVMAILFFLLILVLTPTFHYADVYSVYFFLGDAAIRWVMFILTLISVPVGVLMPWCGFTSKELYRSTVKIVEQPSTTHATTAL